MPANISSSTAPTAAIESGRDDEFFSEFLDVVGRDRRDAAIEVIEVDELAERELAAAEARHPRVGVFEGERGCSPQLADRATDFFVGHAVGAELAELVEHQFGDLADLGGRASGVDAEDAGVGVARRERVHGVREAALLAHLLEESRRHAAAEDRVEHASSWRVGRRWPTSPATPSEDVGLLDGALRRRCRRWPGVSTVRCALPGVAAGNRRRLAAERSQPAATRAAVMAATSSSWSTAPATVITRSCGR